jgi:hypothetical protein
MTSIEVVAFGTLWVGFLTLGALVLVLYRQVEKAYSTSEAGESGGLLAGVEAPDVEVAGPQGTEPLRFPEPGELALLGFVTATCEGCAELVRSFRAMDDFDGRIIGLVNGEDTGELRDAGPHVEMRWLAHPPDVIRSFGIRTVPHTYVVRGRTVLASGGAMSRRGLEQLVDNALQAEAELDGRPAAAAAS